jgi:hypothetical protein
VLASYRYQIINAGFNVQTNIQPDLPPVLIDRDAMCAGGGAQQFHETLSVSRERPAEVWPAPGVRLRSYFEPRAKGTGAPAGACFEGK